MFVSCIDVVLEAFIGQQKDFTVTMLSKSVSKILPEHDDHVRMTDSEATWTLKPLSKQTTVIEFYGHADPAGLIPYWIVNLILNNIPKVALENLHKLIQELKYRQAKLATILPQFDLSFIKLPY